MNCNKKTILISLILTVFLIAPVFSANQLKKTGFIVTGVAVDVVLENYTGSCPKTFKFTGYITANQAGTIQYSWLKNTSTLGVLKTLRFEKPGTKKVYSSWTLGINGKSYKNYWQKIQIISPNRMESAPALFTLKCVPMIIEKVRVELFPFEISGNIQPAPGTSNLAGRKVLVKLWQGSRVLYRRELSLEADGITAYKFKLRFTGRYKVTVEKGPEDSANYANTANICFDGTDPGQIFVDVVSAVKNYPDKNFNILNTIAWDRRGICWQP